MFDPSAAPVTGSAVTGLTNPTYTFNLDVAPSANGKQYAVTALGGTQTNVRTHTVTSPFSATWFRDPNPKQPGVVVNGVLVQNGVNKHRLVLRCGLLPVVGQQYRTGIIRVEMDIPAGAEIADAAQLKALISCLGGIMHELADDHFDTVSTAIV